MPNCLDLQWNKRWKEMKTFFLQRIKLKVFFSVIMSLLFPVSICYHSICSPGGVCLGAIRCITQPIFVHAIYIIAVGTYFYRYLISLSGIAVVIFVVSYLLLSTILYIMGRARKDGNN